MRKKYVRFIKKIGQILALVVLGWNALTTLFLSFHIIPLPGQNMLLIQSWLVIWIIFNLLIGWTLIQKNTRIIFYPKRDETPAQ